MKVASLRLTCKIRYVEKRIDFIEFYKVLTTEHIMVITYPALYHKEDDSYWVEFPDLEGCQTFSDTLNETVLSAQEALLGYVLTLLEGGQELKEPSNIKEIETDKNSFTSLVTCDISNYLNNTKAVKKTLTIPSWLNEKAIQKGVNFSGVLQEALIRELEIIK